MITRGPRSGSAARREPWANRGVAVAVAAAVFVVMSAGPASAHLGDSPSADNFSGSVTSISPDLPSGITVEIIEFGNRLRLTNTSDETVAVPGYSAEPYLQIGPDGVHRNENSPATYLNLSRDGTTPLPERVDPKADPSWARVSSEPVYEWHDHRTHWMSALLPPEVRADPESPHRVIEWTIPLQIDGATYEVSGVLDWTPPPPGWLSYLVLVGLIALGAGAGWVWRSGRLATWLLVLASAASLWHATSTPVVQSSSSSVVYGVLTVGLPTAILLALSAFAVRAARRSSAGQPSGSLPYLVGIAGWLSIAEAIPDLDVLFRSNVASLGPAWAARLAVLLLLGLGAGLAIGAVGLARSRSKPVGDSVAPAVSS